MSLKVKALWAVLVFFMAGGTFSAQEKKGEAQSSGTSSSTAATPSPAHDTIISPEDAARKNPVRFTEASVDRGMKVYKTQCALCHGEKGDGKGDLAKEMTLTLPDFTKPDALAKRTDGELFAIVGTGKDPMPSQKGRMTEPQLWNLVNYLRALGGKVPAKSTAKESADENVILVPK
jgi:mono/diheme cytochrome c family protein